MILAFQLQTQKPFNIINYRNEIKHCSQPFTGKQRVIPQKGKMNDCAQPGSNHVQCRIHQTVQFDSYLLIQTHYIPVDNTVIALSRAISSGVKFIFFNIWMILKHSVMNSAPKYVQSSSRSKVMPQEAHVKTPSSVFAAGRMDSNHQL